MYNQHFITHLNFRERWIRPQHAQIAIITVNSSVASEETNCVCVQREGHTSLVKELEHDLREKPGAMVLSVGGGGLLNGVVEGLRRAGWDDVPIVAMETIGAHSLNAAMKAGHLVTLPSITR